MHGETIKNINTMCEHYGGFFNVKAGGT